MEKSSHSRFSIPISPRQVTHLFRRREVQREDNREGLTRLQKQLEFHNDLSATLDRITEKSTELRPEKQETLDHLFACTAWLIEHHPKGEDSPACLNEANTNLDDLYFALTDRKSLKKLLGNLEQQIKIIIEGQLSEAIHTAHTLQADAAKSHRTLRNNQKIQSDAIRVVLMDALLDKEGKIVPELLRPIQELLHSQAALNPPDIRAREVLWVRLDQLIQQPGLVKQFNELGQLQPNNIAVERILRIQLKDNFFNPKANLRLLLETLLTPVVQNMGNCARIGYLTTAHLKEPGRFLNSIAHWVEHGQFLDEQDPPTELPPPNIATQSLKSVGERQSHTLEGWMASDTVAALADALILHPVFANRSKEEMEDMFRRVLIKRGKKQADDQIEISPMKLVHPLLVDNLDLPQTTKMADVPTSVKPELNELIDLCINALEAREYCLPMLLWQNTITSNYNKHSVDLLWRETSAILLVDDFYPNDAGDALKKAFTEELKNLLFRSVHYRLERNLDVNKWKPVNRLHWRVAGDTDWRGVSIHDAEDFLKHFSRMIEVWSRSNEPDEDTLHLANYYLEALLKRSGDLARKLDGLKEERDGRVFPLWALGAGVPFAVAKEGAAILNTAASPSPIEIVLDVGGQSFLWSRPTNLDCSELLADLLNRVRAVKKQLRRSVDNRHQGPVDRITSTGLGHSITILLSSPSMMALIDASRGADRSWAWVQKHLKKAMNRLLQRTRLTPTQVNQFQTEIMSAFLEDTRVAASKLEFKREPIRIRTECSLAEALTELHHAVSGSIRTSSSSKSLEEAFDRAVCKCSMFQSQAIVYADTNWAHRNVFLFLMSPITFEVGHYSGYTNGEMGLERVIVHEPYPSPHI